MKSGIWIVWIVWFWGACMCYLQWLIDSDASDLPRLTQKGWKNLITFVAFVSGIMTCILFDVIFR